LAAKRSRTPREIVFYASIRASSDILVVARFPAERDAHLDADTGETVKRAILLICLTGTGNHSRTLLSH